MFSQQLFLFLVVLLTYSLLCPVMQLFPLLEIYSSHSCKYCWGTDIYLGFLSTVLYVFSFIQIPCLYGYKVTSYSCQEMLAFSIDSRFLMVQHLENVPLSYSQMLIGRFSFVVYLLRKMIPVFIHFVFYCALLTFLNLISHFTQMPSSVS